MADATSFWGYVSHFLMKNGKWKIAGGRCPHLIDNAVLPLPYR